MTNEQKNQVAAMNAAGMSIDEILIDTGLDEQEVKDFVAERNALKKGRGHPISAQTKRAIVEWYQSGHTVSQTAKKFGVDPKTVKAAISPAKTKEPDTHKKKEPAAAATATELKQYCNTVQDTTYSRNCQVLKGVEIIGMIQTMIISIEENFGSTAEIKSLRADSNEALVTFNYGGTDYAISFGLMF